MDRKTLVLLLQPLIVTKRASPKCCWHQALVAVVLPIPLFPSTTTILPVSNATSKVSKTWRAAVVITKSASASRSFGWIHRAYSLRRAEGGELKIAYDSLLPAADKFPSEALIPYNLACYICQMGNQNEAHAWLERAFKRSDSKALKLMALDEPDLEQLWTEISKI